MRSFFDFKLKCLFLFSVLEQVGEVDQPAVCQVKGAGGRRAVQREVVLEAGTLVEDQEGHLKGSEKV